MVAAVIKYGYFAVF